MLGARAYYNKIEGSVGGTGKWCYVSSAYINPGQPQNLSSTLKYFPYPTTLSGPVVNTAPDPNYPTTIAATPYWNNTGYCAATPAQLTGRFCGTTWVAVSPPASCTTPTQTVAAMPHPTPGALANAEIQGGIQLKQFVNSLSSSSTLPNFFMGTYNAASVPLFIGSGRMAIPTPTPAPTPAPAVPVVSQTVGSTVTLTSAVTGSGYTYAWYKNGVALGVTTSSLTLTSAQASGSGTYTVVAKKGSTEATSTFNVTIYDPNMVMEVVNSILLND